MTADFLIAPKLLRLHFWAQPFFNRAAVNFGCNNCTRGALNANSKLR